VKLERRSALLALPLALALVAAGCGGSSSGGGNAKKTTNNNTNAATGIPPTDINPQPVSALKQGGTIIWGVEVFGPNYNYNQVDGTEGSLAQIDAAVMPEPSLVDGQGNITFDPSYWTSVKEISTNPQKIEYKLNPKAKWSNGTPITAADFIAEWKANNGSNTKYDVSGTQGYDQMSDVAQGTDPYDVIVTFKAPYSEWQLLFNPLYPAITNSTPAHFDNDYKNAIPYTAGPFKFGSINKSAQTVTVVADPKWWGAKPHLDKIVFKTLEGTAEDQAFANGEIDYDTLIANVASEYQLASSSTAGKVRVSTGPLQRQFTLGQNGVLKDVNIRRAIALGIDRLTIAKSDLTGLPVKNVQTLNNHFFLEGTSAYKDDSGDFGQYNPTKAKQMLDSLGWKMGSGGFRTKGGQTLTIKILVPSGVASTANEAKLIQPMMAAIGIKAVSQVVPSNDQFPKYINKGNFDLAPFTWQGNATPVGSSEGIYKCKGGENYSGICNPQIDQDLDASLAASDHNVYVQKANDADKLIWDEVHTIMLFQRLDLEGVKNGLANLGAFGVATIDYTKIGFMK
jgi:peptide/nickel transport system substrate-binding protein